MAASVHDSKYDSHGNRNELEVWEVNAVAKVHDVVGPQHGCLLEEEEMDSAVGLSLVITEHYLVYIIAICF